MENSTDKTMVLQWEIRSGFLVEIFMRFFEISLKDHRIWYRYVVDVFAICSCRKVDATLNLLNKCYYIFSLHVNVNPTIKYRFWTSC